MNKIEPRTLKGFRDFLPVDARKRQYVIETLKRVFESYGFEPLETPALEYEDILSGKYGEEGDRLMYRFEDAGGRKVALRYDQTVPLARVAAQYKNQLPTPFKRYQIQNVWRAENTQKGRFREFLQCDIDILGIDTAQSDVEILEIADACLLKLGFKNYKLRFNSRKKLVEKIANAGIAEENIPYVIRTIDKLKKIGLEAMESELRGIPGVTDENFIKLSALWQNQSVEGDDMTKIWLEASKKGIALTWDPTLARGLDYYTGIIIEAEIDGFDAGSVGGGGRYNNLIGMFDGQSIPAVGFSFGFDRIIEAMDQQGLFPDNLMTTKALITIPSFETIQVAQRVALLLRSNDINTEVYLDENAPMEKQFKYAEKKEIQYVIIPFNENEVELRTKSSAGDIVKTTVVIEDLPNELR